jgi:hypothetical protein
MFPTRHRRPTPTSGAAWQRGGKSAASRWPRSAAGAVVDNWEVAAIARFISSSDVFNDPGFKVLDFKRCVSSLSFQRSIHPHLDLK